MGPRNAFPPVFSGPVYPVARAAALLFALQFVLLDALSRRAPLDARTYGVILRGADSTVAARVAEKLLRRLRPLSAGAGDGGPVIGIALHPEHGLDAGSLVHQARFALAVAHHTGSAMAFCAGEGAANSDGSSLMTDLPPALKSGQIFLEYQPQVDLRTRRPVGLEALVRWRHPQIGLIPPQRFIPAAEATGLIRLIDSWVLEAALIDLAVWRRAGVDLPLAVNLSARSLEDQALPSAVAGLLDAHGIPPPLLKLEITETSFISDPARTLRILTDLRGRGVRISLDDFGAGYSTLAYLQRLPLDEVKIDRSFVGTLGVGGTHSSLIQSMIDLGHRFRLDVVAEGVEDRTRLDALRAAGCDAAQGFFLALPMPAAEVSPWLRSLPLAGGTRVVAGGAWGPGERGTGRWSGVLGRLRRVRSALLRPVRIPAGGVGLMALAALAILVGSQGSGDLGRAVMTLARASGIAPAPATVRPSPSRIQSNPATPHPPVTRPTLSPGAPRPGLPAPGPRPGPSASPVPSVLPSIPPLLPTPSVSVPPILPTPGVTIPPVLP